MTALYSFRTHRGFGFLNDDTRRLMREPISPSRFGSWTSGVSSSRTRGSSSSSPSSTGVVPMLVLAMISRQTAASPKLPEAEFRT